MSHKSQAVNEAKIRGLIAAESGLERGAVDALLTAAIVRHFPRGASIYPQGTHRGSVFLLLSGTASVSIILPSGDHILCAFYQPGAMFGFPIVESERPRWSAANAFTATVVAV